MHICLFFRVAWPLFKNINLSPPPLPSTYQTKPAYLIELSCLLMHDNSERKITKVKTFFSLMGQFQYKLDPEGAGENIIFIIIVRCIFLMSLLTTKINCLHWRHRVAFDIWFHLEKESEGERVEAVRPLQTIPPLSPPNWHGIGFIFKLPPSRHPPSPGALLWSPPCMAGELRPWGDLCRQKRDKLETLTKKTHKTLQQ